MMARFRSQARAAAGFRKSPAATFPGKDGDNDRTAPLHTKQSAAFERFGGCIQVFGKFESKLPQARPAFNLMCRGVSSIVLALVAGMRAINAIASSFTDRFQRTAKRNHLTSSYVGCVRWKCSSGRFSGLALSPS